MVDRNRINKYLAECNLEPVDEPTPVAPFPAAESLAAMREMHARERQILYDQINELGAMLDESRAVAKEYYQEVLRSAQVISELQLKLIQQGGEL